jgi:hypothetical protein
MARTNTEVVSQLPEWEVTRSVDHPSWLVITCPYENCKDYVLVRASRWLRPLKRMARTTGEQFTITARSCPYCFRAAHIPPKARIR